jgi:hypothetical protein
MHRQLPTVAATQGPAEALPQSWESRAGPQSVLDNNLAKSRGGHVRLGRGLRHVRLG